MDALQEINANYPCEWREKIHDHPCRNIILTVWLSIRAAGENRSYTISRELDRHDLHYTRHYHDYFYQLKKELAHDTLKVLSRPSAGLRGLDGPVGVAGSEVEAFSMLAHNYATWRPFPETKPKPIVCELLDL